MKGKKCPECGHYSMFRFQLNYFKCSKCGLERHQAFFQPVMDAVILDKKRPGGEFGKRLKDRFIERENNEVGKGDGGIGPNPVFPIPPKNRFRLQSFFNFQGTAVKPQCIEPDCDTYIHERAYWDGDRGPLCYRCWLTRGDKHQDKSVKFIPERR